MQGCVRSVETPWYERELGHDKLPEIILGGHGVFLHTSRRAGEVVICGGALEVCLCDGAG